VLVVEDHRQQLALLKLLVEERAGVEDTAPVVMEIVEEEVDRTFLPLQSRT
jgi:hypothetical protein